VKRSRCHFRHERGNIAGSIYTSKLTLANAIIGGLLIGAAAAWLWLSIGRIAGISGIAAQALSKSRATLWPLLFIVGLGIGGWIGNVLTGPAAIPQLASRDLAMLAAAGLLVGFGTRLGSGCTSGHGVCGSARLSMRSVSATAVFLAVGMLTATLISSS
jgi:uncharacterized membrane protein YedE/YeeE